MLSPDNLLRAIADRPRDLTPRLVLADWLEEQGDPAHLARAELLRLQARLKGLRGRARREAHNRARELLDAHPELLGVLGTAFGDDYQPLDTGLALVAFLAAGLGSAGDRLQEGSVWVGALHQHHYAHPTELTITSRRVNAFTGEMEQDFTAAHGYQADGHFWFEGAVLAGRFLAFVTTRIERRGIFPGLYTAHLRVRNPVIDGSWAVPNWLLTGTFRLERRQRAEQ
jgi:uncharacterized protein (TIGR02996 family)